MVDLKSLSAAQYILDRARMSGDPALTPMQLIKLVYIAHGYMLGVYGRPLLNESVEAWQYGPVIPSVYHSVKEYKSSPVSYVPGAYQGYQFDPQERQILDYVAQVYGRHNGVILSSATHQPGTPWHQTWSMFGKNAIVSNDLIEAYYTGIKNGQAHFGL